eukprot:247390-Chlamydomonas_euryale.AAC.3
MPPSTSPSACATWRPGSGGNPSSLQGDRQDTPYRQQKGYGFNQVYCLRGAHLYGSQLTQVRSYLLQVGNITINLGQVGRAMCGAAGALACVVRDPRRDLAGNSALPCGHLVVQHAAERLAAVRARVNVCCVPVCMYAARCGLRASAAGCKRRAVACAVAWLCGCMAVWLHGCVAAWLCGCMASWHQTRGAWLHRASCTSYSMQDARLHSKGRHAAWP